MTIDIAYVREFHQKFNDLLKEFARQNNLTAKSGTARYDESTVKLTVTFEVEQTDHEKMKSKKQEWYVNCKFFNLLPEDFGSSIVMGGDVYIITGLSLKAKRNVVEIKRESDGKMYRCNPLGIRTAKRVSPVLPNPGDVLMSAMSEVVS